MTSLHSLAALRWIMDTPNFYPWLAPASADSHRPDLNQPQNTAPGSDFTSIQDFIPLCEPQVQHVQPLSHPVQPSNHQAEPQTHHSDHAQPQSQHAQSPDYPEQAPSPSVEEPAFPAEAPAARTGTDVLKGTGPELGPDSPARSTPTVSHNLVDMINKTLAPSKDAEIPPETSHGGAQHQGQHPKGHQQPAQVHHNTPKDVVNKPGAFSDVAKISGKTIYGSLDSIERLFSGQQQPARPRPAVRYNPVNMVNKTRATPQDAESSPETSYGEAQNLGQYPGGEQQSAKRQRLDDSSLSPLSSPDPGLLETQLESEPEGSNTPPAHFNKDLLDHIWPTLVDGGVSDPIQLLSLDFYRPFISLPRKRNLEWNLDSKRSKWTYRTKVDIISLLVQLTGIESPECCSKCDPQIGSFMGCIIVADVIYANSYYGCANCLYHGTQTYCSLKAWSLQRSVSGNPLPRSFPPAAKGETKKRKLTTCLSCASAHYLCSLDRPSCRQCQSRGLTCRYPGDEKIISSAPVGNSIGRPLQPRPTNDDLLSRVNLKTLKQIGSWTTAAAASPQVTATAPKTKSQPRGGPNVSTTSDEASELDSIPSMETWERAPGRIRSQAPGKPESEHARPLLTMEN